MTRTIRLTQRYPHPPDRVWRALTDTHLLARWLMPNDFQPEVGHCFQFTTRPAPGFDGIVRCRVLEIVPERRISFTWTGGGIDTVVTFDIEPAGEGTVLTMTQAGFQGVRGTALSLLLGNGWGGMIRRKLPALLGGLRGSRPEDCAPSGPWRVLNWLWRR